VLIGLIARFTASGLLLAIGLTPLRVLVPTGSRPAMPFDQ
jgi:hypothetical protein